jgi:hypothetical protein
MGKIEASAEISVIFAQLKEKKDECKLSDLFYDLPVYYENQNTYENGMELEAHNFLAELNLTALELPDAPEDNGISFKAQLKTEPDFLKGSLCYTDMQGITALKCNISQMEDGEIVFSGSFDDLTGAQITLSDMRLLVRTLTFTSGTIGNSVYRPVFYYKCKSDQSQISLPLLVVQKAGSRQCVAEGEDDSYHFIMNLPIVISLTDVPIVGGIVSKFLPNTERFSIRDITMYVFSEPDKELDIPAGVRLCFTVLGEKQTWQVYESVPEDYNPPTYQCLTTLESPTIAPVPEEGSNLIISRKLNSDCLLTATQSSSLKIHWIKLEKTVMIFTLHRIGVGLDDTYLMFALDASLNVSPLTFSLYGAGIGVNLKNYDLKYYISGFGIEFKNDALMISGELIKEEKTYAGTLLIQVKQISVFAVAEYSEDGTLFAYAVLSAPLGGPPAFFVTGLALGFGYHKHLAIPAIDEMADFPLIKGAMGQLDQKDLLTELKPYITDEIGQKFITFGVKFTTFEVAESFALLTVSFGNNFEINMLGLSDITVPPHCPTEIAPLARAQLALKITFAPADGFFGVEARLTSESYILSKDCHLKGGFAFYMWFAKEHSGDFVITLGGYHPKFQIDKPKHYPDVPRVGFSWNLGDYVNICGEMYFALTPSTLMAGGRLSVIFTLWNIKAYFIAKADFLICWKPFHYDIEVGVIVGASLHVSIWFVSFTISIELGTQLHIWGPDFTGRAYVSLWIISFEIAFGANASQETEKVDWDTFCLSFLPKEKSSGDNLEDRRSANRSDPEVEPLSISFVEGLSGQVTIEHKVIKAVRPGGLTLSVDTVIPISKVMVNHSEVTIPSPVDVYVKPMRADNNKLSTEFTVSITKEDASIANFEGTVITKNMPTALWGGEGELRENVPSGIFLKACSTQEGEIIFPEKQYIVLDDLYLKGATIINNAFCDRNPTDLPSYTDKDSILIFSTTVNSDSVARTRVEFLKDLGVTDEKPILLTKYAAEAESFFDEEVSIPVR